MPKSSSSVPVVVCRTEIGMAASDGPSSATIAASTSAPIPAPVSAQRQPRVMPAASMTVEALTVILAAGITRGWRCALTGAGIGALVLAAIVALLGPSLAAIPISVLQTTTGTLLLLFGMRWIRKAMLRYAGVIAMRDEDQIYARERQAFGAV